MSIDVQLALEDLDWSLGGVYGKQKSLIGLNFASFLTGLVMKKSGAPQESKILPQHVFQLQSIVDFFTVSSGWSMNHLKGHVLEPPRSSTIGPRKSERSCMATKLAIVQDT